MKRLIAVTLLLSATTTSADETPQRAIYERIPEVIDFLRQNNVRTVGVLKFRVRKSGESTSDSVGPVNSLMADRLEIGLILRNSPIEDKQLLIIKDASSQAAQIPGADHLKADGRACFFGPKFDLAWGSEKVEADAFLTGIVQLHKDQQTATVGLLCFFRDQPKLIRIGEAFEMPLTAGSLSELGESFVLRGAFDGGSAESKSVEHNRQAKERALEVKQQRREFPTKQSDAPVQLEVRYDGQKMEPEIRRGRAFLPTPLEGQVVEFRVRRTRAAKGTLGVVLKVNGENTLYRETGADVGCSKWLLTPDWTETSIRGYQLNNGSAEEFVVLSQAVSARKAMNYGREVGQIQLTVFAERKEEILPSIDEEDQDLIAMLRGSQPARPPENLSALKFQLTEDGGQTQTRGLINPGEATESEIEEVTFQAQDQPLMAVTLTYYTP